MPFYFGKEVGLVCALLIAFISNVDAQTIPPLPEVTGTPTGSLAGEFLVNEDGASTYSVQLSVPPGTAGVIPELSLVYNSRAGDGPLGVGWSIQGLSGIARCPTTIAQDTYIDGVNFNADDQFCLDGQRLVLSSGSHGVDGARYRTLQDKFIDVQFRGSLNSAESSFIARLKSGLIYEYGATSSSRIEAQGRIAALAWNLAKVADRNGNYFTVSYFEDTATGESYPTQIDYTGNSPSSLAPYNSVRFSYVNRSAHLLSYVSGSLVTRSKLLSSVSMYLGNALARQYRLSYNANTLTYDPHLTQVEECDQNNFCLPPTRFDWPTPSSSALGFIQSNETPDVVNFSPAQGYSDNNTYPIFTGDWDGDGKTDIARVYGAGVMFLVSRVGGFGWWSYIADFSPAQGYSDSDRYPIFTGDWNGDGRTDIGRVAGSGVVFYISTPSGFGFWSSLPTMGALQGWTNATQYPVITGDWNGDGRTDFGRVHGQGLAFYLSTNSGFQYFTDAGNFSPAQGYSDSNTYPIFVGDWNGDGKTDVGRVAGHAVMFLTSQAPNGFAWTFQIDNAAPRQGYVNGNRNPILIGDYNGDGLSDFSRVHPNGFAVWFSTGTGAVLRLDLPNFSPAQGYTSADAYPIINGDWNGDGVTDIGRVHGTGMDFFITKGIGFAYHGGIPNLSPAQGMPNSNTYPLISGDWNGDGLPDVGRVSGGGIGIYLHGSAPPSAIGVITNGFGAETRIDYKLLTDPTIYTKGSGATYPTLDVIAPARVTSAVRASNGLGGLAHTSYQYSGLRADLLGRGSLGFERFVSTDEQSRITSTAIYNQAFPISGLPARVEKRSASGILLSRTTTTWGTVQLDGLRRFFNFPQLVLEENFELDGSLVTSKTTRTLDLSEYGAPKVVEISYNDGGIERTVNTFESNLSAWLLDQLTRTVVTRQSPGRAAITRTSAFTYLPDTGLLNTETVEPDISELRTVKSYAYDVFGNIRQASVSAVGELPRTSSTFYDPRGQFAVQTVNPLGHVESNEYDPRHGLVTRHTGPNGISTSSTFDAFGRLTLEQRADGTLSRLLYLKADAQSPSGAGYFIRSDVSGSSPTITQYDILGREIRTETVGFDGRKIYADKAYDEQGRLVNVSEPYFSNEPVQWGASEYDLLNRITIVTAPGGRISRNQYSGLTVTQTDPQNKVTVRTSDVRGKLKSMKDSLNNLVTYSYDSVGNLTSVTDPSGNTTFIEYNLAGKRTRIIDPDTGITVFSYNPYGELKQQTDALNRTITFGYDKLGRLITRSSVDGVETLIYDNRPNGIGKIGGCAGIGGYEESYSYDLLGRLISTTYRIPRPTGFADYTTSRTYDFLSRPSVLTYPSGFKVGYGYNSQGKLTRIYDPQGLLNGSTGSIWEASSRNARHQLTSERYGNGLVTEKTYYPTTGLIDRIKTGTLQDLKFTFDSVGNLTRRSDLIVGMNESFNYDSLYRLTQAQVDGQVPLTMSYDALGNILTRSDVGSYSYGATGSKPHAVKSIVGPKSNQYLYDAIGNRISANGETISYDAFNRPSAIFSANADLAFRYSPDGKRFHQSVKNGSILREEKVYIESIYEEITTATDVRKVHFIAGPDGTVAHYTTTSNSSDLHYIHRDHLGSIQTITGSVGNLIERLSFDAWGNRRNLDGSPSPTPVASSTDRGFTGHEHLDEVSLIHMNGRVYDPIIGRFLTADPIAQDPTNLQSLNRYSYVGNNPLSMTDPSGYSFKKLLKVAIVVAAALTAGTAFLAATGYASITAAGVTFATNVPVFVVGASGAIGGFGASIAGSAINGGGVGNGFRMGIRNAPVNALSAIVGNQIGKNFTGANSFGVKNFGAYADDVKAIAHGLANGAIASAAGNGKFGNNFISGVAGSVGAQSGNVVAAAVAGGAAAALSGGKFDQGAMSGALIYLYNEKLDAEANRHNYTVRNQAVRGWNASQKNAEDVFDAKLYYATPFASGDRPIENNGITDIPGIGPVRHVIDRENLTIYNITLPGHLLYPGVVTIHVSREIDGIYINTSGTGTGNFKTMNELFSEPLWNKVDGNAIEYLREHKGYK